MTDAEILAAMRAKKAEADRLKAQATALETEKSVLLNRAHDIWCDINALHTALLYPERYPEYTK